MVKILFYLFFLGSFLLLIKLKWKFVFFIPIFNLIADMSFTYFTGFSAPTLMRAAILFLFLIYAGGKINQVKVRNYFFVFFAFILIMLLFSKTFIYSFRVSVQIIMSMSMFIIGYSVFKDEEGFPHLITNLKPVIYAALIVTIIGYLFNIGRDLEYTFDSQNGSTAENVGLLGSGGMYVPGIVIGLLPFLLRTQRKMKGKIFLIISASILYIFILLNVRRTAIVIPVIGLFGFFIYIPSKLKIAILRYLVIILIGFALAYPLYSKILSRRYKVRESQGRFEKDFYKTEGRYLEYFQMFNAVATFEDPAKVIFGKGNNMFVDTRAYGVQTDRMIHSDIPKIFYSLGLTGVFLYLLIYLVILREILSIPAIGELRSLKAALIGLFFISIFASVNGSITLISFRILNFLLIGSFLGYARKLILQGSYLLNKVPDNSNTGMQEISK